MQVIPELTNECFFGAWAEQETSIGRQRIQILAGYKRHPFPYPITEGLPVILTDCRCTATPLHSFRNAMSGSTAAARSTGAKDAKNATMAIPAETATKVAGSTAETPKSNEDNRWVPPSAPSKPTTSPIPV